MVCRRDEDKGHQVITDSARHVKDEREHHQSQHERVARQVLDSASHDAHSALAISGRHLVSHQLLSVVVEGWAEEAALESAGHQSGDGRSKGPHEQQWFGRVDRDQGRGNAGEDVTNAGTRGDDGKYPLAFKEVEMLAHEGPELQHHQLETDRVDDIRRERDRRTLADQVGDEYPKRRKAVEYEGHAKGAANPKPSSQRALEGDHRPNGQRQDDEEQRISGRPGLVEEQRLCGVESGVSAPADDDGKTGHLKSPIELSAPHVKKPSENGEHRVLPDVQGHGRIIG